MHCDMSLCTNILIILIMRFANKLSAEVLTIAKIFVILLIVLYGLFSFIEMEVNPGCWSIWSRAISSLLLLVGMGYVTRNLYD